MKLILTLLDNIYSINTYQIMLIFDQGTCSFAFYECKFSYTTITFSNVGWFVSSVSLKNNVNFPITKFKLVKMAHISISIHIYRTAVQRMYWKSSTTIIFQTKYTPNKVI